jgi:hypothetical protein
MDLQLLQKDTVFFDKKQFEKIIDDILNLLDTKNTQTYLKLAGKGANSTATIPDEIRAEIVLLTNR